MLINLSSEFDFRNSFVTEDPCYRGLTALNSTGKRLQTGYVRLSFSEYVITSLIILSSRPTAGRGYPIQAGPLQTYIVDVLPNFHASITGLPLKANRSFPHGHPIGV